MNPTVLVTGATGNVGSEVIRMLNQAGAPFRAAIRSVGDEKILGLRVEDCVHFDFLDPRTYGPTFEGIRTVFLVRPPNLANPKEEIEPAILHAQSAGVRHIVFLSLLGAEKNPFVPHHKIENLILASGIPYTFRFFRVSCGAQGVVSIRVGA